MRVTKLRTAVALLTFIVAFTVAGCGGSNRQAVFLPVPAVSIIGTPQVGQTLIGSTTYAGGHWAWLDCSSSTSSCTQIAGTQGQVKLPLTPSLGNQWLRYEIESGTTPPANAPEGVSAPVQIVPNSTSTSSTTTSTLSSTTTTSPSSSTTTSTTSSGPSQLTFDGNFETGPPANLHGQIQPWGSTPQSGNWQGQNPGAAHYLGDFFYDNGHEPLGTFPNSPYVIPPADGNWFGRLVLPTTPSPFTRTGDTLQCCKRPLASYLGQDEYYGLMFYVPAGETLANKDFSGDNLWEFNFNAVWGDATPWELHTQGTSNTNGTGDSVVQVVNTGSCNPSTSSDPGCQYRSQAGIPPCNAKGVGAVECLPPYFAIPPGQLVPGQWMEIAMHLKLEATPTGVLQDWYRVKGQQTWIPSANVTGIPTVQWSNTSTCCGNTLQDLEQYTGKLTAPFTVGVDDELVAPTLQDIENALP